jgi:hypothetical protein
MDEELEGTDRRQPSLLSAMYGRTSNVGVSHTSLTRRVGTALRPAVLLAVIAAWLGLLASEADEAQSATWSVFFSLVALAVAALATLGIAAAVASRRRALAEPTAAVAPADPPDNGEPAARGGQGAPSESVAPEATSDAPAGDGAPTEQQRRVRGRKVARLVKADGEWMFEPVSGRGTYNVEQEAECISPVRTTRIRFPIEQADLIEKAMSLHQGRHAAPGLRCGCGFHATREDHPMLLPGQVIVDVELSSKRIKTKNGYRAAHQRVVSVHVPRQCAIEDASEGSYKSTCGRFASGVLVLPNGVWPMCDRHGMDNVPLTELSARLGIEVSWLEWGALGPVEDHPELAAGVAEFLRQAAERVGTAIVSRAPKA